MCLFSFLSNLWVRWILCISLLLYLFRALFVYIVIVVRLHWLICCAECIAEFNIAHLQERTNEQATKKKQQRKFNLCMSWTKAHTGAIAISFTPSSLISSVCMCTQCVIIWKMYNIAVPVINNDGYFVYFCTLQWEERMSVPWSFSFSFCAQAACRILFLTHQKQLRRHLLGVLKVFEGCFWRPFEFGTSVECISLRKSARMFVIWQNRARAAAAQSLRFNSSHSLHSYATSCAIYALLLFYFILCFIGCFW